MGTWNELSEKKKGHRIKNGEVVKFFQHIGFEKVLQPLKATTVNETEDQNEKQKSLKLKNKEDDGKKLLEASYKFGKSEKLKVISSGGIGTVYQSCLKSNRDQEVAIQVIDKKKNIDQLEEIKKNFTVMKSLDHPNIANFYETYEDGENLYLVMEYLDEKKNLMLKINPDEDQEDELSKEQVAFQMIKQLQSAIRAMHSDDLKEDLVHGDLKPENVFLTGNDVLKISSVKLFAICDD